MKRDGHTHTHFCLHGSGEEAEGFVIRAIELGFTMYSLTEHLPYPPKMLDKLPYPKEWLDSIRIRGDDFDAYLREMEKLKKKYRGRIQLLVGAEIDFLPEDLDYTRAMLKEYGPYLDDSLLSVHFLKGRGGWRCVDHSPADFREGLLQYYNGYEQVQLAYYRAHKEALECDLGPYKPKRIAHFSLCNKFQCCFNPERKVAEEVKKEVIALLDYMSQHGYSLDVNAAGLYKEYCREIYPSFWVIALAAQRDIPLVYGSDAHAISEVGRSYEVYENLVLAKQTGRNVGQA